MESSYVLILLVLLIIVLVGIVFFGYRQLTGISVIVNQHSSAIGSLREFLNRMLTATDEEIYQTPMMQSIERNLHQGSEHATGGDGDGEGDGDENSVEGGLTEVEKNIEEQIEKDEKQPEPINIQPTIIQPTIIQLPSPPQTISEPVAITVATTTAEPVAAVQPVDEKKDNDPIKVEDISIDTATKPPAESEQQSDDVKTIEIKGKESKASKLKFPPNSPKDLAVGDSQLFEGKLYVVYEQSSGAKRWRLFKP